METELYWMKETGFSKILLWFVQSSVVWMFALFIPVVSGILLSYAVPGRHSLAKWCEIKWSIYLTPIFSLAILMWAIYLCISYDSTDPFWFHDMVMTKLC